MTSEIASRYGQGLLELAKENNTVKEKKQQAESLLEIFETTDLLAFLRAVKVTDTEKKQLIDNVFKDVVDLDMIHFLKLLIDRRRTEFVKEILKEFDQLTDEELGILKATVVSARALKQSDLDRIQKALSDKTGKEIVLKTQIDPSLIAGIKVITDGKITDVSMKTKVDQMKQTLMKGGQASS